MTRLGGLSGEERRRIGLRGQVVARNRYDWGRVTDAYEELFRGLRKS
jgi:glycosyltransferase involved in cell wall biosynthesis